LAGIAKRTQRLGRFDSRRTKITNLLGRGSPDTISASWRCAVQSPPFWSMLFLRPPQGRKNLISSGGHQARAKTSVSLHVFEGARPARRN
jgi:hypothetical protein